MKILRQATFDSESRQLPPKKSFFTEARKHFKTFGVTATDSESPLHSTQIPRCHQRCSLYRDKIQMTHYLCYDRNETQSECAHRLCVSCALEKTGKGRKKLTTALTSTSRNEGQDTNDSLFVLRP